MMKMYQFEGSEQIKKVGSSNQRLQHSKVPHLRNQQDTCLLISHLGLKSEFFLNFISTPSIL